MKKNNILFTLIVVAALCCFGFIWAKNKTGKTTTSSEQTDVIVKAATTFLNSLNAEQRTKILFGFARPKTATAEKFERKGNAGGTSGGQGGKADGPPKDGGGPPKDGPPKDGGGPPKDGPPKDGGGPGKGQFPGFVGEQYGKAVWSNFPVSDVPRPGMQLGSFTSSQRAAAMHLLQVLLSDMGYEKVMQIMGSDQALADGGTNFLAGKDSYTLAIFGTPDLLKPWMVEFGGHHLALNIVIAASEGALTPTLTGAQPSVYQSNGKTIRVLAAENDKAFNLLDALNEGQRKKTILNYKVNDLVLGPGHDGEVIVPEGLKGSEMAPKQKEMLTDLISQWVGIINNTFVQARMEEIKSGINDTYFAWSGPTTHQPYRNGSSYYRIQGPHVIIEFSPQGVGGDLTMHVHTIYRDPLNNYGNTFPGK